MIWFEVRLFDDAEEMWHRPRVCMVRWDGWLNYMLDDGAEGCAPPSKWRKVTEEESA